MNKITAYFLMLFCFSGTSHGAELCHTGNICFQVGIAHLLPEETADIPKAIEYLEAGCRKKHAQSCIEIGSLYENGNQITRDLNLAKQYFSRACSLKTRAACAYAAEIDTPEHNQKLAAKDRVRQNIEAHGGSLLYTAGQVRLYQGEIKEAVEYFEKSCYRHSHKDACDWLEQNGK